MTTRLLLYEYNDNVWHDIEFTVDPDHLCKSFQISTINKKPRSKTPLKPKAPSFEWVFMNTIPDLSYKVLIEDTTLDNQLLIMDAYFKLPRLYGAENITTGEVMDKLGTFQARFVKADKFGW